MAISTTNVIQATIQMRSGIEDDFDPSQMTAGEWAVSTDTKYVRMCFTPGFCLRMATYEAFEEDMEKLQEILKDCQNIQIAIEKFVQLAEQHKTNAEYYSAISKSWAVGGTGEREGEDTDNSMYYSQIAKELVEEAKRIIIAASAGGLIPAGTILYEELPESPMVGFMYNIRNSFVTDERFEDGAGAFYSAGNNVYWNANGKWDVLSGIELPSFAGVKAELDKTMQSLPVGTIVFLADDEQDNVTESGPDVDDTGSDSSTNIESEYVYIERFVRTDALLEGWTLDMSDTTGVPGYTEIYAEMYNAITGEYLGKKQRPSDGEAYKLRYIPLSFSAIPYAYIDRYDPWPRLDYSLGADFFAYVGVYIEMVYGSFIFRNAKALSECPLYTWYKSYTPLQYVSVERFTSSIPAFLFRGFLKKINDDSPMYLDTSTKKLADAASVLHW